MAARTEPGSQHGFTYLMILWWVAISSIVLAALGQHWMMESRRQREMELAFRGEQIRRAIDAFYDQAPDGQPKRLPTNWAELLDDRRRGHSVRHLRRLWPDPMTGRPWGLIREGPGIKGVYSQAQGRPLRGPDGVDSYEAWRFEQGQPAIRPR